MLLQFKRVSLLFLGNKNGKLSVLYAAIYFSFLALFTHGVCTIDFKILINDYLLAIFQITVK